MKKEKTPQNERPRAAGVKDVAKAAGVSVATVSRAFNLPHTVSDDSREKVLAMARKLGYEPNPAAKALRLQRSYVVGAVFPTTDHGIYARTLSTFQQKMSEAGYMSVLLSTGFDNRNIHEPVSQLVRRGVEGLMMVGRLEDPKLIELLRKKRIPVVSTYSLADESPFPHVGIDNYRAVYETTTHLLSQGHREFAMLSGPTAGNDRQQARGRGFIDALAAAGISDPRRIYEDPTGYSVDFAARTFRMLREQHPAVTAIVCSSDVYGLVVMSEAKRMGLRVPQDLSVTGFDDQEFAALLDPPLTTVAVRARDMGRMAAQVLAGMLEGAGPVESLELPAPLVIRGSSGKAPAPVVPGTRVRKQ